MCSRGINGDELVIGLLEIIGFAGPFAGSFFVFIDIILHMCVTNPLNPVQYT